MSNRLIKFFLKVFNYTFRSGHNYQVIDIDCHNEVWPNIRGEVDLIVVIVK